MIAAGLVEEQELNSLIEAVTACVKDEARMQVTFTVIQVWGQKP